MILQQYFSHLSSVIYFSATPHTTKTGIAKSCEITNSKPPEPISNQSDHIYYTLLWYTVLLCLLRASANPVNVCELYHFAEPNWRVPIFLHPILLCRAILCTAGDALLIWVKLLSCYRCKARVCWTLSELQQIEKNKCFHHRARASLTCVKYSSLR